MNKLLDAICGTDDDYECQNGGKCSISSYEIENEFTCECTSQYWGQNCEICKFFFFSYFILKKNKTKESTIKVIQ